MPTFFRYAGCMKWAVLVGLCGCAAARQEVRSFTPPPGDERGIVFTANGAGGWLATSNALRQALRDEGLPLRVEAFEWSHGTGRVFADQTDYAYARAEGKRLAEQVAAYRRARPTAPIFLVAHSAGCAVVLAAVEALPAGTVDRVVLMAPAISADYDLRPALRAVRCGVDVFCSRRDMFYLGIGTGLVGTADRHWSAAAGRTGFRQVGDCPEDAALYAKLRQHTWHPCQMWTGNLGGHYGAYRPGFLKAYVLPCFQTRS
jgi:pimeloyl-ACP methyl ester carboxylesterase